VRAAVGDAIEVIRAGDALGGVGSACAGRDFSGDRACDVRHLVTDLPEIRNDMVQAPTGSGLCTSPQPEVKSRSDASIRVSPPSA
jgi:hypothetical protein